MALHIAGCDIKAYVLSVLFCAVFGWAPAQSDCDLSVSKKAEKLLSEAQNSSRLSNAERYELVQRAVEEDPDCLRCNMDLARLSFRKAEATRTSWQGALQHFQKVKSLCPDYHADVYYYLGLIYYSIQEYTEAAEAFNSFLEFPTGDASKVSRDHSKKIADVNSLIEEVYFYSEFYENPVPFDPQRVSGINTPQNEYLPMLSPDNEIIFYTRQFTEKRKGDLISREIEEFMQSERADYTEPFPAGKVLPPPFNVGDNYGGVSISVDNREMYITVCTPVAGGYNNCDLYVTHRKEVNGDLQWSELENLGPEVNTPDGWEAQPSLSSDGKTLYFASVRAGSTPDEDGNPTIDIYYTTRKADGTWNAATPAGPVINTAGNDKSPFLHSDSRTLYFASNGRIGAGGYDIFYSRQNKDGSWSKPKNIGYPINTAQDEHGLIVSTDGKYAYYASADLEKAQGLDIFSFAMPGKARPDKVLLLKGTIETETGEPLTDAHLEIKYSDTTKVEHIPIRNSDGGYAAVINLHRSDQVLVTVKTREPGLQFTSRSFSLADTLRAVQTINQKVEELKPGSSFAIEDIHFATNSSDILPDSKKILKEFADYLKEHPRLKIRIEGHTDNVGDDYYNLVLSTDRAFEIMGYLQEQGVPGPRMKFAGYGETRPIADNTTAEGRAANRRTEFLVLEK